ncbi:MAG: Transcriptional regulatory protein SrrA [Myxococcota bacterium]|nr:Transcriptional regulatory protein SrrA [Myxococcota bacterium]
MSSTILIIEDEKDLLNTLDYGLRREGYATRCAGTGKQGLDLGFQEPPPDLILLDLMLPDISGIEVCRQFRQTERTRQTPVIILTAKAEEIDRVVGFEVGADDYVVKPFSTRELLLRIRAILRRRSVEEPMPERIEFGRLKVDTAAHRVWVDNTETQLTALEFRLLTTFLSRKGRVQTRDTLLNDVWSIHADVTTRTVDTHVKRLREKLGAAEDYIETIRGVGYRFRDRPDEGSA